MTPETPRRRGRPVTTGRSIAVNVLLSPAEERTFRARARRNGVTLAAYLRGCAHAVEAMCRAREAEDGPTPG